MSGVPHSVLADALRAEVGDGTVTAAVLTTFPLEVEFLLDEVLRVVVPHSLSVNALVRREEIATHLLREDVPVAVFHDAGHLEPASGPSRVPVSLVAVQQPHGVFHPKVVLLLVRPPHGPERVVLAVGSANLTRAGWWSNVEALHVSSTERGSSVLDRDDLLSFLDHLAGQTRDAGAHRALDAVREVLASTHRRQLARLAPDAPTRRFVWKGAGARPGLVEQLHAHLQQPRWDGYHDGGTLEVLSPWYSLDGATQVAQLLALVPVAQARVVLPRAADSSGLLPEGTSTALPAPAVWAQLPADRARLAAEGAWRPLHAKLFRWTPRRERWETCVVGSFNLTPAAFQRGGNLEAAVVVDRPTDRAAVLWLDELPVLPHLTQLPQGEDDDGIGASAPSRAALVYDWQAGTLALDWAGGEEDLALTFYQGPVEVLRLRSGRPGPQALEDAQRLRAHLERAGSVLQVREGDREGLYTVVTELRIDRKPSSLVRSVADVVGDLLLEGTGRDPERRGHLADDVGAELDAPSEDGTVAPGPDVLQGYAALYEASAVLQQRILEAVDAGDEREARHRLVGQGSTTVGGLLSVAGRELDARPRYVLVVAWAVEALLAQVRAHAPATLAGVVQEARARADEVRRLAEQALGTGQDEELRSFLSWARREFDRSSA